jgi:L,D-transpeptidase YcbB
MRSSVIATSFLALLLSTAAVRATDAANMPAPAALNWPPKPPVISPEPSAGAVQPAASEAAMPTPNALNWPPQAPKFGLAPQPAEAIAATTPSAASPGIFVPPLNVPIAPFPAVPVDEPKAANVAPVPPPAAVAPPAAPAFALAEELGDRLKDAGRNGEQGDRKALARFYESRQFAPVWVSESGLTTAAKSLKSEIEKADDYGLEAGAFKSPELPNTGRAPSRAELANAELTLSLSALKYARHAKGGRTEPAQLNKNLDRAAQLLDPQRVIEMLSVAKAPDAVLRGLHPKHPQFEMLRQAYLAVKAGKDVEIANPPPPPKVDSKKTASTPPPAPKVSLKKLLANMEQWRWMPEMGDYHIWSNIPEFAFRIVRGGNVVHSERIIAGKPDTQTPIFSDEMELVVFQPYWNVPESIKWKELQPQLSRSGNALAKAGLTEKRQGR